MNILIDCTNLKVGGGIQVATSFINDINLQKLPHQFFVVLSNQMINNFDRDSFQSNITFIDLPKNFKNKYDISKFLLNIEKEKQIDKVFTVFGPSYYKSSVPKIVGFALPHFIYKNSPYFNSLSLRASLRLKLLEKFQIYLFKKNSDELVFETQDALNKFIHQYNYTKNSHVVNNTINEIFLKEELWEELSNIIEEKKI